MKIGVLGKMGAGKNTVADLLGNCLGNSQIIDLDNLAHSLYIPGTELFNTLVVHFGPEIVDKETGLINRKILARQVFSDEASLGMLNTFVQPVLRKEVEKIVHQTVAAGENIIITGTILHQLGIPMDVYILVQIREEIALRRLLEQGRFDREEICQRWKFQPEPENFDFCIQNNGSLPELGHKVRLFAENFISSRD